MAKNTLETTIEAVNGGNSEVIATGKSEVFEYRDGKSQTSEPPIGTRYDVALPGNRLSPLSVKILGKDPLPGLTDEAILRGLESDDYKVLVFSGSAVKIYTSSGGLNMTATAKSVAMAEDGGIPI